MMKITLKKMDANEEFVFDDDGSHVFLCGGDNCVWVIEEVDQITPKEATRELAEEPDWYVEYIRLSEELEEEKNYTKHLEDMLDESTLWDYDDDDTTKYLKDKIASLESILKTIMMEEEIHGIRLYRYIGEKRVSNAYYLAHNALNKGQ